MSGYALCTSRSYSMIKIEYNKLFRSIFHGAIKNQNFKYLLKFEREDIWKGIWYNLECKDVIYSDDWGLYQSEYFYPGNQELIDLSFILLRKDKSYLARMHLNLFFDGNDHYITSHGLPVSPPNFTKDTTDKEKKKTCEILLKILLNFFNELGGRKIKFEIPANTTENKSSKMTHWHLALAKAGCTTEFRNSLIVSLSDDLNTIRQRIRKSYKPFINKGLRTFHYEIYDEVNYDLMPWNDFKNLHLNVSGRKTRSELTWKIQKEMVKNASGVLICLYDKVTEVLTGAAFFQFTEKNVIYASAAYNRSYFNKPVGHVVQWLAIDYFKKRGLQSYIIGEVTFPEHLPKSSEKLREISFFKEGFTDAVYPRFVLTYNFNDK